MIKNEWLRIYHASQEQMEKYIASEKDEDLRKRMEKCWKAALLIPENGIGMRCG